MRDFKWQKDAPATAHPIIRFIWREMKAQRVTALDLAERSGVSDSAMRKWKRKDRSPQMLQVIDVLNALGYKLVIKEQGNFNRGAEIDLEES